MSWARADLQIVLLFLLPLCESSLVVAAGLPLCPRIVLPFASQLLVLLFQSLNLHRSLQEESVGASKGYKIAIQADDVSLVTSKLTIPQHRVHNANSRWLDLSKWEPFNLPRRSCPRRLTENGLRQQQISRSPQVRVARPPQHQMPHITA